MQEGCIVRTTIDDGVVSGISDYQVFSGKVYLRCFRLTLTGHKSSGRQLCEDT